ncbi:J domain-containing protein [uncultured Alsobacter sp.]|uniref:J domain-containing protein n=1 Tax=uncultured Alsobacter sp. TaxID=1748258 RepID=UPI0025E5390D|nr:J domain-containing protein [uncultured Alsobacter sp.]
MRDPYVVLGVGRSATEADIKKAFRRLAKAHHPDRNPTDPKARDTFAEINNAYEILGDADKRKKFDAGEIDAEGKPRFTGFEGFGAGGPRGGGAGAGFENFHFGFDQGGGGFRSARGGPGGFDASDIFSDLFSGGRGGPRKPRGGADVKIEATITLAEAVKGTSLRVTLPSGRDVEVKIPAGIAEGQTVRLKGQGHPSPAPGGPPGDVLVSVHVRPDRRFAVEGNDIRLRLPIRLDEAVLGAKVRAPTLEGAVELTIPANSSSGRTLRLRGKGLPSGDTRGDLLVTLEIVLPPQASDELKALMERWSETLDFDPRKDF